MARTPTLRLVGSSGVVGPPDPDAPRPPALGRDGDLGDLVLTATILATSLLPLVGLAAGVGHWGQGELGLGTLGALFAGRELWSCARAALRNRRHP